MTLRSEESWVRDATFLCRLEREDQDRMLAVAQREQVGPRLPLLRGRSGVLLLSGEVEVDNALALGTHRGAPGQLFGAGSLAQDREPSVTSATPVELLRWRHEDLDPATVGWAARDLIQDLAELDHQMDVLDDVLRQEPTLRALPPAWREQLLQCCTLRDCAPGEVLVRSGHRSDTLTLLLRGTARLTTAAAIPQSGPSSQLIPHGTLLGVQDFDAEQPPVQPYHIDAPAGGRALFIPWRALAHLFKRQRASRPRSVALSRDARRGRAHLIHTVSPNLGASTVAIGTAIALGQQGAKAAVLDLNGGRTAQRLGLDRAQRTIEGLKAWMAPLGPGLPEIWWPARDEDAERLLMELQIQQDHVLIGHVRHGLPPAGVLDRLTTLIHLFAEENDVCEAPLAQHQRMIHALRLPNGGYPGLRTRPRRRPQDDRPAPVRDQIVRIPFDSAVDEVYRRQRAIRQLGMGETPFGRSTHRLARMLLGKATGLALGGGGAWGFAHVGLLRALHEADLPVDYVSGTSFGAVVGAAYVGGGLAALEKLERSTAVMPLIAGGCVLSTAPLGAYMDWLVGPIHQLSTEIPLLAVASDVRTASSYVLPTGTLADAVRSSSGFPGLFASYDFGGRRLVDGGVSANVPAEVAQKAGADFILASNCIPRMMDDRSPVYDAPVLGRAMDLVRSTLAMMHRSSARDAALADHVFNARTGDFAPAEFWAGPRIAELAYEQALGEIPAIRAAYEADLSTHLAEG